MSKLDVDRWREAASLVLTAVPLHKPIAVEVQEAEGLAEFLERYWEPDPKLSRPGFASVGALLPRAVADEIRSLAAAVRTEQTSVLFPEERARPQVERALEVVGELRAALEFVLDDDVEEPADAALAEAKAREVDDGSRAQLAQSLSDYAGLAETLRDRLAGVVDDHFKLELIGEAEGLAAALNSFGAPIGGRPASASVQLRDRLLTLLVDRVARVRKAARFVFRRQPEIVRQATSAYERRRRTLSRRGKDAEGGGDAGAAGEPTVG